MHLVVGTPMYGGQCSSGYNQSMLQLQHHIDLKKWVMTTIQVGNESLVPRARNKIANVFLTQTEAEWLLFMDGDQAFRAEDVLMMLEHKSAKLQVGLVPMKGLDWNLIRRAALVGWDDLEAVSGIFNFVHADYEPSIDEKGCFPIKYGGSGYMLIHRDVFRAVLPKVETYKDRDGRRVHNFFTQAVHGDELLSEDYNFCRLWGHAVTAVPWCYVEHFGTYRFRGSFDEHLRLGEELEEAELNAAK